MRWCVIVSCCLILGVVALSATPNSKAQAPIPAGEAWTQPPAPPVVAAAPTPAVRPMKFRDGPNRRERKAMGLTFSNVRRITAELQKTGEITEEMTRAEVSTIVANRIVSENPNAFQDPELDWDALLAWIEAIMELVMRLIALFSNTIVPDASGVATVAPFMSNTT